MVSSSIHLTHLPPTYHTHLPHSPTTLPLSPTHPLSHSPTHPLTHSLTVCSCHWTESVVSLRTLAQHLLTHTHTLLYPNLYLTPHSSHPLQHLPLLKIRSSIPLPVYMAKLAEQAERYDEMVSFMKEVAKVFFFNGSVSLCGVTRISPPSSYSFYALYFALLYSSLPTLLFRTSFHAHFPPPLRPPLRSALNYPSKSATSSPLRTRT